jgi:hypothetical protein
MALVADHYGQIVGEPSIGPDHPQRKNSGA